MKIWIINHYAIPPSMGGMVRHYYFSKYLQERGHQVKIFTSSKIHNTDTNMIRDRRPYLERDMDGVGYTFVRTGDYKGNGLDRIVNMLQFPLRIWRVCGDFERPDVIYTSSPDLLTAVSAVLLAKRLGVRKLVEVRDLWPESLVEYAGMSRRSPVIWALYRVERWLYRNADRLVFTMAGGRRYIREKGWTRGIDPRKIHHVNNGVDLGEFEYNRGHFQVQDGDLEDDGAFKIVYAGSIRAANDVGLLIKAVEELGAADRCRLLLYGDGTDREGLEGYCREHGLRNIKFKGKVDKRYIPYILSRADLNIVNYRQTGLARYGGSQNKLFEYLASGRPVCSNVRMAYSLIRAHHCGVEADFPGPREYAGALRGFMEMPEGEYGRYARNARGVARMYDYRALTEELERILKDMVR